MEIEKTKKIDKKEKHLQCYASVMKELSSYSFNPQIRNMQLFTLFNQYLFIIYFLFFILELFLWGSYTSITWY